MRSVIVGFTFVFMIFVAIYVWKIGEKVTSLEAEGKEVAHFIHSVGGGVEGEQAASQPVATQALAVPQVGHKYDREAQLLLCRLRGEGDCSVPATPAKRDSTQVPGIPEQESEITPDQTQGRISQGQLTNVSGRLIDVDAVVRDAKALMAAGKEISKDAVICEPQPGLRAPSLNNK